MGARLLFCTARVHAKWYRSRPAQENLRGGGKPRTGSTTRRLRPECRELLPFPRSHQHRFGSSGNRGPTSSLPPTTSPANTAGPNPSLNLRANGMPQSPRHSAGVYYLWRGLCVTPLAFRLSEGLGLNRGAASLASRDRPT